MTTSSPRTWVLTANVDIHEVNDKGTWFDFGFVIGVGILLEGGLFDERRD